MFFDFLELNLCLFAEIKTKGVMNMSGLNIKELSSRFTKPISYRDSLKDVVPIDWDKDILTGKKKAEIRLTRKQSRDI